MNDVFKRESSQNVFGLLLTILALTAVFRNHQDRTRPQGVAWRYVLLGITTACAMASLGFALGAQILYGLAVTPKAATLIGASRAAYGVQGAICLGRAGRSK